MKRTPRVAVLGGGVYVVALLEALALRHELPELELRLHARRYERTKLIAMHCQRWLARRRPRWTLSGHESIGTACADADAVIVLVRVGGWRARAHDESFPASFGLVGDEGLGVGGFANAWRSVPKITEIARVLRRVAGDSKVFNLAAPLGITTRVFLDEGLDTVGICELPELTLRRLRGPSDAGFEYAGMNHLGFFWGEALKHQSAIALEDPRLIREFQALPSRYYTKVFASGTAPAASERARELAQLSEHIFERMREAPGGDISELEQRPTPWFEHALVPALVASLTAGKYRGFANVRNAGKLGELPEQSVVELPATWSGRLVTVRPPAGLPARVGEFLARVALAEALAYEASRAQNAELLAAAIARLPLPIPPARVAALTELARQPIANEERR